MKKIMQRGIAILLSCALIIGANFTSVFCGSELLAENRNGCARNGYFRCTRSDKFNPARRQKLYCRGGLRKPRFL